MQKSKCKMRSIKILCAVFLLMAAGCAVPTNTPTPMREHTSAPTSAQLRIMNVGGEDIKNLTAMFPAESANSPAILVKFGDVAAGSTSTYVLAPRGVYAYAAYEYEREGRRILQPVMDWVGEKPMEGKKFTYQIVLNLSKRAGEQIELATVMVDEK